jgi:two-component system cell cycle sensor histidine kinase/response regulator CckA
VRAVTRQILMLHGYQVREAGNGHEAIGFLGKTRENIDLLITDIVMPGMAVSELMARAASLRPELRVLCVSGYAEQAILHQALVVDKTPFLSKPYTAEALTRKVRQVLDDGRRKAA